MSVVRNKATPKANVIYKRELKCRICALVALLDHCRFAHELYAN